MVMSAQVLIAHTGQRLEIDTTQFTSLDEFKASVARQSSIPAHCLIALTAQGRSLKLQTIQAEKEIFVYDHRLTQATTSGSASLPKSTIPLPKRYNVSNPPDEIDDTRSLQSWQNLFKARRAWAMKVVEDCGNMAAETEERASETDVILRCLDAAVANLAAAVKSIEPKLADVHGWAPAHQTEYAALTTTWEQNLSLARSIPVSPDMVRFMTLQDTVGGGKGRPQRQTTLEELVDLETAKRAGRSAPSALRKFNGRVGDLEKAGSRFLQQTERLFRDFDRTVERSDLRQQEESLQLLQDIEAVAKKIDTDYQTTLEYTQSTRDVAQVSKIAANHTERLLPSIRTRSLEMDDMLRFATQTRNDLAEESVAFMRDISEITAASNSVKAQLNSLMKDEEYVAFDYLRLIQQVPYMYATFVAEAVRRREWFDKVKQDSSTLANEMAVFQDEESKRRRRWFKTIDETYGPESLASEAKVPGLEVNLVGEDDEWPAMTRKDLEDFYETLQREKADAALVKDVGKLISELNNPTKQQSKRLKAFKNGSIHEAALGRSQLLIRGDDDLLRSLQDDKSKLENKLKTAESRVRRLEDLLHRQSQATRPSLGDLFQMPSQQTTDRHGSLTSVVGSPRSTETRSRSSDGESLYVQRIQQLEAELKAEKAHSAALLNEQGQKAYEHDALKAQLDEANLTKNDLLQNMEALKRESVEERKGLEDEIKRLQAHLEDTESEIEHFGESRMNEKAGYDEMLHELQAENERLAKEKKDDLLKAEGQVEFLRKETRLQRDRMETLEKELRASSEQAGRVTKLLTDLEDRADVQLRALTEVYEQLSHNKPVPTDLNELVESVLGKTADFMAKVNRVEGDMAVIRSDLEVAESTTRTLRTELESAKQALGAYELTEMHLKEEISQEKAKASTLEQELTDGRAQLDELRERLAHGETGSESLRQKLEEDEAKIRSITEELASRQSQVGSLEEELLLYKDRLQNAQTKLTDVTSRLDSRTDRAKDISQKLYSQNDRLIRLLERMNYSVTREGGQMTIQKIPRAERSSQNSYSINDISEPTTATSTLRKSGTLNSRVLAGSGDLEPLYWMNAATPTEESDKYTNFLSTLGLFDTDAFADIIFKRQRDVELLARKYQKESRAYRDRIHTLQRDAHDKIAFKSFKEGDLALFLPTRNQNAGAWAAFNVGAPHYFLREQEGHRLGSREWLVARISKIHERVVDLSKSLQSSTAAVRSDHDDTNSLNNTNNEESEYDNPFDLSDGLRWYLIDAAEDKPGAPSTPGLGKSTVAANKVDAVADMRSKNTTSGGGVLAVVSGRSGNNNNGIETVSKSLSKSLESRRSSTGSRKAPLPFSSRGPGTGRDSAAASETNSLRAAAGDTPMATSPTQTRLEQQQGGRPSTPLAIVRGVDDGGPETEAGDDKKKKKKEKGESTETATRRRHVSTLQREVSGAPSESPSKKSVVWDSLWSLDVSYEGGGVRKGR